MKVVALKDLNLGGTGIVAVTKKKGDVFELPDTQPVGGKIYFYNELGTGKKLPLVLGTDISVLEENNQNPLPPDRKVKARLLKDFGTKGMLGTFIGSKGDIIDVQVRDGVDGSNKVYIFNVSTGKNDREFIIGTDVELVTDKGITKEKLGSYMFVGAIIILSFIAYKLIKEK
jgi:hypothetical protein